MATILWVALGWITWQWPDVLVYVSNGKLSEISDWALLSCILGAVILTRLALSPYLVFREMKAEVVSLKKQLGDKETDEDREIEACFERMVAAMRDNVLPFNALMISGAYRLHSNDLVISVCERFVENGHSTPFAGLKAYVLESECRDFLKYVKLHAENIEINPDEGVGYLNAAERWRKKRGHPEPSPEDSLDKTFLARRDNKDGKGLKVSVDVSGIRPYQAEMTDAKLAPQVRIELSVRLIFTNTGKVPRTVFGVQFVYCDPERVWGKSWQLLATTRFNTSTGQDNSILVNPDGTEVIASYGTILDTLISEKPGAEFGVRISYSDGKGGQSRDKIIMMITASHNAQTNSTVYSGKRLLNVSLDDDA